MASQASFRIMKELKEFHDKPDSNLYIYYDEANVMKMFALLIGPEETPYEYGLYEFSLDFPADYPSKAPQVKSLTTNRGTTRFNPNIYASGKVCLSILGTWRGEPGEEWRSSQGFQSVLVSILSLMNQDPYKNEPGFEEYDKPAPPSSSKAPNIPLSSRKMGQASEAKAYISKIRHESIRISVIERLEEYLQPRTVSVPTPPPNEEGYEEDDSGNSSETAIDEKVAPINPRWIDLSKRLFLCYFDRYMETVKSQRSVVKDGTTFASMPFEIQSNGMYGKFNYKDLEARLLKVREAIDAETESWVEKGGEAFKAGELSSLHLESQLKQCQAHFSSNPRGLTINIENEHENPFVWTVTYFGKPMTKWDGGLFRIRMVFPITFPAEQPRVRILTPFFHANVSKEGIPFYRAVKQDSAQSHIEGIIKIFENDMNPDPSCVLDKKCAEMYWTSGPDGRKEYSKMIRKVVSRSADYE